MAKQKPSQRVDEEGLTLKQQAFKRLLLDGMDKEPAGKKLGISRSTAFAWAALPAMVAALEKAQKQLEESGICTRMDVMRELWKIGSADLRQVFREDTMDLMPITDFPDRIAGAIAGVKIHALYEGKGDDRELIGYSREVKLFPKVEALDKINKMIGAYAAPKEPVGPDGKPVTKKVKVFVVPAMRSEADMADHGRAAIEGEFARVAAPEEAPPPVTRQLAVPVVVKKKPSLKDALTKLERK